MNSKLIADAKLEKDEVSEAQIEPRRTYRYVEVRFERGNEVFFQFGDSDKLI